MRFLRWLFGEPIREYPADGPAIRALRDEGQTVKLVVGLGNLEPRYLGTRHNIGFDVVDAIADEHTASFAAATKLKAHVCTVTPTDGDRLVLAKPTTLMNRSGFAITALIAYYNIDVAAGDLLVICDDFTIDLGMLRMRPKGSHGGQNGLRHIIEQLGHSDFARLRCGIGPVPTHADPADFVLSPFKATEKPTVVDMLERAQMAVLTWNTDGVEAAQQRYNGAG